MKWQKNEQEKIKSKMKSRNAKKAGIVTAVAASTLVAPVAALILNEKISSSYNDVKQNTTVSKVNNDTANSTWTPLTSSSVQTNALQDKSNFINIKPFLENGGFTEKAQQYIVAKTGQTKDQVKNLVQEQQKKFEETLSSFAAMKPQQGSSSSKHLVLNSTSGFQSNFLDQSFWRFLIEGYNQVHGANAIPVNPTGFLFNHVRFFYRIGSDKQNHYLDGSNIQSLSGRNTFDLGDVSSYVVNGQLPDITLYLAFDDFLTPNANDGQFNWSNIDHDLSWIAGHGASFTIYGGKQPSDLFKNLDDYKSYVLSGKFSSFVNTYPKTPGLIDSPLDGKENTSMSKLLNEQLTKFVNNLVYSGDTSNVNVHINQNWNYVTSGITNFIDKDGGKAYPDGTTPHFYYSIDGGQTLTLIPDKVTNFNIPNIYEHSVIDKNGLHTLPNITYYFALSSKEDNSNRGLRGYDPNNSEAYFEYVGVKQDDVSTGANGVTKTKFSNIKDVVSEISVPQPKNDSSPDRTVDEVTTYSLVNKNINGNVVSNKELLEFRYRIVGEGDSAWKSKSEFFGANKPGSTIEALTKGVEWVGSIVGGATPTNDLKYLQLAADVTRLGLNFIGRVNWNLPLVTSIPKPTITIDASNHWSINLPSNADGIDYQFKLKSTSTFNGHLAIQFQNWENGKSSATVDEIKSFNADYKQLYNPTTGEYLQIECIATPINTNSSAKPQTFDLLEDSQLKPSAAIPAQINTMSVEQKPAIDNSSTDTAHIKFKLSANNPWNFVFSVGNNTNLKLDAQGFLVDSKNQRFNTYSAGTKLPIHWSIDPKQPTKPNSFVNYTGSIALVGDILTTGMDKYISSWTSLPNIVPGSNTMVFDINEGDSVNSDFPVPLQYSIDGHNWFSKNDFLAIAQNGDDLYASTASGGHSPFVGTRNLFDSTTGTYHNILFRTTPNSLLAVQNRYVIDSGYAKSQNLTAGSDGSWQGTIATSKLDKAISSQIFANVANIPTLTGTNSTDYVITPPNIDHVQFKFRLKNEGSAQYQTASEFKASHLSLNATSEDPITKVATYSVQEIVWIAEPESGYEFVDSWAPIKNVFVDHASGVFKPQTLVPANTLAATIPHIVSVPRFSGDNTKNLTLEIANIEQGEKYFYSTDNITWKPYEDFQGTDLIDKDGITLKDLHWKVDFTAPHVAASGSITSGILTPTGIKVNLDSVVAPTASIFSGTNTLEWQLNTTSLNQPGVTYYIYIGDEVQTSNSNNNQDSSKGLPGTRYSLAELKAQEGKLNLFDQAKNQMKSIHWSISSTPQVNFSNSVVKSGEITLGNMTRWLDSVAAPTFTGTDSMNYTFNEDAKGQQQVEYQYSVDTKNYFDQIGTTSSGNFHSNIPNLYNAVSDSLYTIYWQALAKPGYIINPNFDHNDIELNYPSTLTKVGNAVSTPFVTGNTSIDYALPTRSTNNHATIKYKLRTDADDAWVDATTFKNNNPNIWNQTSENKDDGSFLEIQWKAFSDATYSLSGNGEIPVSNLNKLTKIIEIDKITTPVLSGDSKTVSQSVDKTGGIDYVYATSASTDLANFVDLPTLIASLGGNLFDGTSLKNLYFVPKIKSAIVSTFAFDKNPTPKPVDNSKLTKVIDALVLPQITSSTNKTNDYSLTPSTQVGVTWQFFTSGDSTRRDFDVLHKALPNLFFGNVSYQLSYEATAIAGYRIDISKASTTGNFNKTTNAFTKVFDDNKDIPAPTLTGKDPNHYEFTTPYTTGVIYTYYIGNESPMSLEDFHKAHASIYDSTSHTIATIHYHIEPITNYDFASTITKDGSIDTSQAWQVITNVVTPKLSTNTINSQHFDIDIHNQSELTTQFSIDGGPLMSKAELIAEINAKYGGNLYQQSKDKFLNITWEVSPTNSSSSLDPATNVSGTLVYKLGNKDIDKFVLPASPQFVGTSTETSSIAPMGLSKEFDYSFGLSDNEWMSWPAFASLHPNLYDSLTGNLSAIRWIAYPKSEFVTDMTRAKGSALLDTLPKYIDQVNSLTLTGSSTEAYNFSGSTLGVTYEVSDSQSGPFVSCDVFKANPSNKNIAGKTLWYKAISADQTKYIINPSVAVGKISSSLKIAIASVDAPTFDPNHSSTNDWAILTPTPHVKYEFQMPQSGDKAWYSASIFQAKFGDKLFDQDADTLRIINYKISADDSSNYILSNGITALTGIVPTTGIQKVVTAIKAPTLKWTNKDHKSNNYEFTTPTHSADYQVSVDGKHWSPIAAFATINLYDSAIGTLTQLHWQATPKATYNGSQQVWTGNIANNDITTKVIDTISAPVFGPKAGNAKGTTSSYAISTPTPNVSYYLVDNHDAHPVLDLASNFAAGHDNLFNNWFALDDVKYVVEANQGYELNASITNTKTAGSATAQSVSGIDTLIKMVDAIPSPKLDGTAANYNLTDGDANGALVYSYRVAGTTNPYTGIADLKSAHSSLDFNGSSHGIDWQAEASSVDYQITNNNLAHGTLSSLASDLEIKTLEEPKITFTDSHNYALDNSNLTSNVTYKFRLAGGTDYTEFDAFKNDHKNLWDKTTDSLKDIEWQAIAKTVNNDTFHFSSNIKTTGVIKTQGTTRFIDSLAIPTLTNPQALSTKIDLTMPMPDSNYATYTYKIDNGASLTLDELKTQYASLDWEKANGIITVQASANSGYAIGQLTSSEINTSVIVKVVHPAPVALTTTSVSTSDYSLATASRFGLNYSISINGAAPIPLTTFLANKPDLYSVNDGLKTLSWSVVSSDVTKFAIAPNTTISGPIDVSSLPKVIDQIIDPILSGTDSTNFVLSIDSSYNGIMDFEYSVDQADYYTYADFKDHVKNLYDPINERNQTIYAQPIALGNTTFSAPQDDVQINTDSLTSVIDVINVPTLVYPESSTTKDYNIDASQLGVDFTFSTDGTNYESFDDFQRSHANLYNFDKANNQWKLSEIQWKANVSTIALNQDVPNQTFKFGPNVVDHGTIADVEKLAKVLDSLPRVAGSGSTTGFTIVDGTTGKAFTIPGVTYSYGFNGNTYATMGDLFSDAKNQGLNMFDVKTGKMDEVVYTAQLSNNYLAASGIDTYGKVDLSKLTKIVDFIQSDWIPKASSGSTQWAYDFTESLPSYLNNVFTYKFSTSLNAPDDDWKDITAFKNANPTLINADNTNKHVYYKIELTGGYGFAATKSVHDLIKGEITLPFSQIIARVDAPTIINKIQGGANYTSRNFLMKTPTANVTYKYRIGSSGQFYDLPTLKQNGFNLYDYAHNAFKDLEWTAHANAGYILNQDFFDKGDPIGIVDLSSTNVTKVIESPVVPVLVAPDSLSYDFAAPQGEVLTTGLIYKLSIDGHASKTIDELKAVNQNLFDILNNKLFTLKWEVQAMTGYSIIGNTTGDILPPADMVKVVDSITPPTYTTRGSTVFSTEDWVINENTSNGFDFTYSVDNKNWFSAKDIKDNLGSSFNNLYNNETGALQTIHWKAMPIDKSYVLAKSLHTTGDIAYPVTMHKAIDVVATPTIPANSLSNNYSFVESTSNVTYKYKLASELDSDYLEEITFIKKHPNLYDENSGLMLQVDYKAIESDPVHYYITNNATEKTGKIDTTPIAIKVITKVSEVKVADGGTTQGYTFNVPSKKGITYQFGTTSTGPWSDFNQFKKLNPNLFSASGGLKHVYWHAIVTNSEYKIDDKTTTVGEINVSGLTKMVDVDSPAPEFTSFSNTNAWDFEPLAQKPWINHYKFGLETDNSWSTYTDFHDSHPDLNDAKDAHTPIVWQVVFAKGYAAAPGTNQSGYINLQDLKTKWDTSAYDLSTMDFYITKSNRYGLSNLPTINADDQSKFHVEYAWGDAQDHWIKPSSNEWLFGGLNPSIESTQLYDNNIANPDGTFGAWVHGGSITFKLVANSSSNSLNSDRAVTINFANSGLLKLIQNYGITVNDEIHVPGADAHFAFLPKYTSGWDEKTNLVITKYLADNNMEAGLGSDSIDINLDHWIENRNPNVEIQVNPFSNMSKDDINELISSLTPSCLRTLQGTNPDLFPGSLTIESIRNTFKKLWLSETESQQFFMMLGDLWTGVKWQINAISARPFAPQGFKLVNEDERIVWDKTMNTISKVTDNQNVINEVADAIRPAEQIGSTSTNVIWGDVASIQRVIAHAKQQNLRIQLTIETDANGNPVNWVNLTNLDDPNDFFNLIRTNPDGSAGVKSLSIIHSERKLFLQVFSLDTDAATNAPVRVTNDKVINITQDSGIQKVKSRITSANYSTSSIKISGFTDGDITIDDSVVSETYLEVTYTIPQYQENNNAVNMTKDKLIEKIKELRQKGIPVYGEDIIAKIDLKDNLSDEYDLGQNISGNIDFSQLYTHADISKYVEDLNNDIALDGKPLDDPKSQTASVYITLDNSDLTTVDFTQRYGIQYRVNDGSWELFNPVNKDLEKDPSQNIVKDHAAGTYMAIRVISGDFVTFRVVPIATAKGIKVVSVADSNHSQTELMKQTRVVTNDWNGTPASLGTLVERKSNDLLSVGENALIQSIDENYIKTASANQQGTNADASWLQPFLTLVTSRPKYENIQDSTFDKEMFDAGELIDFTTENTVTQLVVRGLISQQEKEQMEQVIAKANYLSAMESGPVDPTLITTVKDARGDVVKNIDGTDEQTFAWAWDHQTGKSIATNAFIIMALDMVSGMENILNRLYTINNAHAQDYAFNRDLLQTGVSSFEISQIGQSGTDQFGHKFSHSNAIFFGTNVIRFNNMEDDDSLTNSIVDAYFIGEDKITEERIAKIHVSTQYSLESMGMVLELENGQTVYLNKDIDGTTQQEVVRVVRLDSKHSSDGKLLPLSTFGGKWLYASETLIDKNVSQIKVSAESSKETNEVPLNNDSLRKVTKHWIAPQKELDAHTSANEMPYSADSFDNGDSIKNVIVLSQTPYDLQLESLNASPETIYANKTANVGAIFSANAISTFDATAAPTLLGVVNFNTTQNFETPEKYRSELVFEQTSTGTNSSDKRGYMVTKSLSSGDGSVYYRSIEQSSKNILVNEITLGKDLTNSKGANSFPVWAIVLASLGGFVSMAGGGYLIYNRRLAKKAAQIKRPTIKIKRKK